LCDFRDKVGDQLVTVAATPNGWADAVSDDRQYFMLPEEKKMHFSDFLDHLEDEDESTSPVLYMQQQNSNLTGEMSCLLGDVPEDIEGFWTETGRCQFLARRRSSHYLK
jgi:peptidyl-lysine (3S)-dioxygenase / protease